jgi:nitrogen fixation protein
MKLISKNDDRARGTVKHLINGNELKIRELRAGTRLGTGNFTFLAPPKGHPRQ